MRVISFLLHKVALRVIIVSIWSSDIMLLDYWTVGVNNFSKLVVFSLLMGLSLS